MSATAQSPVILHADQEHGGLRMAIFVALFVGLLVGFLLVAWLLRMLAPPTLLDYTYFLACVGAIPVALLFIWGLEKILKRSWHSGLSIILDDRGLTVEDRRGGMAAQPPDRPALLWSEHLAQLNWYFRLSGYPRGGRERRIPAKWLCLATELQQNEARLNVFAFMPPAEAERWTGDPRQGFHILNPAEAYEHSVRSRIGPPTRPTLSNRLLQSKDGRHWLAERRRWEYGVELTPDDFATLMTYAAAAQARDLSTQS